MAIRTSSRVMPARGRRRNGVELSPAAPLGSYMLPTSHTEHRSGDAARIVHIGCPIGLHGSKARGGAVVHLCVQGVADIFCRGYGARQRVDNNPQSVRI